MLRFWNHDHKIHPFLTNNIPSLASAVVQEPPYKNNLHKRRVELVKRLKLEESEQLEWQGKRLLTKINYLIHTDAIKTYLIPIELTDAQKSFIYASEADMLNVALFGMRAKEWKDNNPDKKGNIRDYASTIELAILSNLEYHNSLLIKDGIVQKERLIVLNKEANREKELFNKNNVKVIEGKNE